MAAVDLPDEPVRWLRGVLVGDLLTAHDRDIIAEDRELLSESLMSVERRIPLRSESVAEGLMRAGGGTGIIIPPIGAIPIGKSSRRNGAEFDMEASLARTFPSSGTVPTLGNVGAGPNQLSLPDHDSLSFLLFLAIFGPCKSSSSTQLLDLFLPLETVLLLSGSWRLSCVGSGGCAGAPERENRLESRLDSLLIDSYPRNRRFTSLEDGGGMKEPCVGAYPYTVRGPGWRLFRTHHTSSKPTVVNSRMPPQSAMASSQPSPIG
ncbi:hypothetical protein Trco_001409 [Trichoderma cornu-damae]|uniref:Uncharacterized protein n=1 Tax=Trichoderma cornu-damae TaxID=654480 RepID=A0A9P8TZX2_9HYPO|nr:hypothetical protein Trco_001409 [Trichoderma cornu-damae]